MSDADREELAHLEKEWMAAMQSRNMDRLEELVADGFRFTAIHLNPEPMTREQWMEAARDGYTIVSGAVGYRTPRWEWLLNAENLFNNEDYFLPGHFGNNAFPGQPINLTTTFRLMWN